MVLGARSDPLGSAVSQGHALGFAHMPRRRLVAPATPHRLGFFLNCILHFLVLPVRVTGPLKAGHVA